MDWVWLVPAVLALAGCGLLAGLAIRTAEEVAGLRKDVDRFGELRPRVAEVRDLAARTAELARGLGRTRVAPPPGGGH